MNRFAAIAAATALALAPAAAIAQPDYYTATPATAPAKASFVTRSTMWKCSGGSCVAAKGNSRDMIMCELVAREIGPLTEFRADGAAFDAEALAKCNTKAR